MKNGLKILLVTLALALLPAIVFAQQPVPLPVVVNPDPAGRQTQPVVVADSNGAMLVAWRDSSAGGRRIMLQGFDWLGHRAGPVVQSASQLYQDALNPSLAVNMDGHAVLCWQELIGDVDRIVYRRFNIDASPVGTVLPLARVISGTSPSVAIDSLGNIALVWVRHGEETGDDIYANLFEHSDSSGVANMDTLVYGWIGDMRINETEDGDQDSPSVTMDHKSRTLVAWRDLRPDSMGIFCRAFSERGTPLGSFRLGGLDPGEISRLGAPVAASAGLSSDSSSFMVSWVETDTLDNNYLMRARVDLDLNSVPPVMGVDTLFTKVVRQRSGLKFDPPALSGNENGDISLVWTEHDSELDQLFGVMFNSSDATPLPALRLTSSDHGFGAPAGSPSLFASRNGSFSLVWQDSSRGDPDIRFQRYTSSGQIELPLYLSPGSGSGDNRAVSFLGLQGGGYEMFWEHDREDTLRIFKAGFDNAGRLLQAPGPVYPDGSRQRRPVTASGGDGLQLLAWEDSDNSSYRVVYSLRRLGSGTQFERKVLSSSANSHLGSLAAAVGGPENMICMLWERWNQGATAPELILARVDTLGNPLGSQQTVSSAASGGGRLASVAIGPEGNQMVAWRQGSTGTENAKIVARVYSSDGGVVRNRIEVSRDTLEYIGSASGPTVAASDSTGNYLVLWREFYSDRNLLYYRLYDEGGDSLQLPGGQWRARLGSTDALGDGDRSYGSAAVAVDSAGGFLVVWSESDPTSSSGLFGARIDPHGAQFGAQFQVPGVTAAAMPVVSILEQQRVAVAWQDTTGKQISFLGVQLHFHSLLGQVLLASSGYEAGKLKVYVEGVATDSASVAADGGFRFRSLPGGDYRVWVSADGVELAGTSRRIELASTDSPEVNMGVAADLRGTGPTLPRAATVELAQNSPNPFNPSTTISFTVGGDQPLHTCLAVYDIRGALVCRLLDELVEQGTRRIEWHGRDGHGRQLSSGVYFLRLSAGEQSRVRKMILLK